MIVRNRKRNAAVCGLLVFLGLGGLCGSCRGDVVIITVPASLTFNVTDVMQATTASPSPFVMSFVGLAIPNIDKFYISVKANAAAFTPPSGTAIPSSKVSWTTSGALGGAGTSGTLSSAGYTTIFQSNLLVTLGYVNVVWQLAAPGTGIRAGNHTLTITYKFQAF